MRVKIKKLSPKVRNKKNPSAKTEGFIFMKPYVKTSEQIILLRVFRIYF